MITWSRYTSRQGYGYEVSSAGDRRFSPLFAELPDGRTIEEAYQLDVKGYRAIGDYWRLGKGKPPLDPTVDLYAEYKALWRRWAEANPALMIELRGWAEKFGHLLTDQFATSEICQARALAELLNENTYRLELRA